MREIADYSSRIPKLMEAERDRNITGLDYIGIGYGYNFKNHYPKNLKEAENDIRTHRLSQLEKLITSMS
jgi:hypothetical protein